MKTPYTLGFILACLLSAFLMQAQLVINEYSASNLSDYFDSFGKTEDWVEIYNASDDVVNLSGWYLSDDKDKALKWPMPDRDIAPGDFMVFLCSARDSVLTNEFHTNFRLSQTKGQAEYIVLTSPDLVKIDEIKMELTLLGDSRCRVEDGAEEWAVCTSPTYNNSNNNSSQYRGYTEAPSLSHIAGFFDTTQYVQVNFDSTLVDVFITTNGNYPTQFDEQYTLGDSIVVEETTIVKAAAYPKAEDELVGKIAFATYFINESFTLPVFSVGADRVQDLANGNGELRPIGSVEYFKDHQFIDFAYGDLNRHGQDSWALPHRSIDWVSRDEMGYSKDINAPLFNYSDRDNHQRLMFRASGDDNYPAVNDFDHQGSCHVRDEYVHTLAQNGNMQLDVRAVERVVLFLNGDYWGVYGLRERPVDHDYTRYYYDQDKYNLHYLATWGNTWAEYGDQDAFDSWEEIRDFAMNEDMSDEENYNKVDSVINLISLIDYMAANLNSVASDWLNYNTGWWRGLHPDGGHKKWGYILWDNDATFDYYINYSGVPNTDPDAVACDIEDISDFMDEFFSWQEDVGQHDKIFLKLIDESETFRQLYYSRMADLNNTIYTCENMLSTFDSLIAIIEPEMPRQIDRWGGSMEGWMSNVADMRDFINQRCTLIDDGMVECYDLTGPHNLTIDVFPAGAGKIYLNTLEIENFPHTGAYFGNMENLLKAESTDDNLVFSHWEVVEGSIANPDLETSAIGLTIEDAESITAVFELASDVDDIDQIGDVKVYPTVTSSTFNVYTDLQQGGRGNVSLLSSTGSVAHVYPTVNQFMSGQQEVQLGLPDQLAEGLYFVKIQVEGYSEAYPIIVKYE